MGNSSTKNSTGGEDSLSKSVFLFFPRRDKVVSFEAPEVVVAAKDGTLKHNPTKKVAVFGSVVEQTGHDYELQWTQVWADSNEGTWFIPRQHRV